MQKLIVLLCLLIPLTFVQAEEKTFKHESSLSLVQTGGNSTAESYNATTDNNYKPGTRDYRLYGNYTLSYADDPKTEEIKSEETARNWLVGAEITQDLNEKLGLIAGHNYEGNEYAGYKQKENSDIGLKYQIIKTDKKHLTSEAAYRYTTEKRTTRDEDNRDIFYFQKANIKLTFKHEVNTNVSYKFWVQYLPNFTDADDYQINFEPSLNVKMSDILSLRIAYKGQYDNELNPGVEEYLDHTTSTALVAKF